MPRVVYGTSYSRLEVEVLRRSLPDGRLPRAPSCFAAEGGVGGGVVLISPAEAYLCRSEGNMKLNQTKKWFRSRISSLPDGRLPRTPSCFAAEGIS